MKILVANHWLKKLGGSETFTYTLIGELVRSGHEVKYVTMEKGQVSDAIEKDFKVKPLSNEKDFDLVLCSHNTMVELCKQRIDAPVIQICHGPLPKLEQPSMLADAYAAVSKEVQLHLLKSGVCKPIEVIHNGIDLDRFKPTTTAVAVPKFILSLSHSQELNTHLKNYFRSRFVHFDTLNKYQNPKWSVEQVMNLSDLVISCGRGAMEAMACGRPVIVMDHRPYMPPYAEGIITPENIEDLLFSNFSGRYYMKNSYDVSIIDQAIDNIDIYTSDRMRYLAQKHFDIRKQVKKYLDYYERIN